jgi:hypothetical protein
MLIKGAIMIRNIIILTLLVTNATTLYYIYRHMAPEEKVTVSTRVHEQKPEYFYRVTLKDGGKAEARNIIKKDNKVDLVEAGKVTFTIERSNIKEIEKVYYKTGRTQKITTTNFFSKNYN